MFDALFYFLAFVLLAMAGYLLYTISFTFHGLGKPDRLIFQRFWSDRNRIGVLFLGLFVSSSLIVSAYVILTLLLFVD